MIEAWWAGTAALFGASAGSYLGVVLDRLPAGRGLMSSSVCGSCASAIRGVDNLPVLSYLRLHGRCRSCGTSIPPVWWLLEVGLALLWGVLAAALGPGWDLALVLLLAWLAVAVVGLKMASRREPPGLVPWSWSWAGAVLPAVASALFAVLTGAVLQGSGPQLAALTVAGGTALVGALLLAPGDRHRAPDGSQSSVTRRPVD